MTRKKQSLKDMISKSDNKATEALVGAFLTDFMDRLNIVCFKWIAKLAKLETEEILNSLIEVWREESINAIHSKSAEDSAINDEFLALINTALDKAEEKLRKRLT